MRKIDIKEDEPVESMEVGREVLDRLLDTPGRWETRHLKKNAFLKGGTADDKPKAKQYAQTGDIH